MKATFSLLIVALLFQGCTRHESRPASPAPEGSVLIEVSGGKQIGVTGTELGQPIVIQVNDKQGVPIKDAPVSLSGVTGVTFMPQQGVSDLSGQFTATVRVGETSGRYILIASSYDAHGTPLVLKLEEVALGWQQTRGRDIAHTYCDRCHDPESSAERVSNHDNLDPKPHAFSEGEFLNRISAADLSNIVSHGGPALGKSAEMPPYEYTLSKGDIEAVMSYIRAIADPPFHSPGVVYAQK